MISKLSELIAKDWVKKGTIKAEDYELYHYGWFVVLSDVLLFTFTIMLGVVFHIAFSSIVFFVTFFVIRRFAGGFHSKTELHCQLISLLFLFLSIVIIKYSPEYINNIHLVAIDLICTVLLFLFSPAATPQKPLSRNERKTFKIITGCVSIAFFVIVCILLHFNARMLAIAVECAFVLETALVLLGKILNHRLLEE